MSWTSQGSRQPSWTSQGRPPRPPSFSTSERDRVPLPPGGCPALPCCLLHLWASELRICGVFHPAHAPNPFLCRDVWRAAAGAGLRHGHGVPHWVRLRVGALASSLRPPCQSLRGRPMRSLYSPCCTRNRAARCFKGRPLGPCGRGSQCGLLQLLPPWCAIPLPTAPRRADRLQAQPGPSQPAAAAQALQPDPGQGRGG